MSRIQSFWQLFPICFLCSRVWAGHCRYNALPTVRTSIAEETTDKERDCDNAIYWGEREVHEVIGTLLNNIYEECRKIWGMLPRFNSQHSEVEGASSGNPGSLVPVRCSIPIIGGGGQYLGGSKLKITPYLMFSF